MYGYFATLESYPDKNVYPALAACVAAVASELPEAAALLERFRRSAVSLGQTALEENYIQTFEMRAEAALYVGHQIFGEDWRRGVFMAGLKERYRPLGVEHGVELPDHLSVVLRFLEQCEPGPEREDLAGQCVVPALRKILRAIEGKSPYEDVLNGLLIYLTPERRGLQEPEEMSCRPSSLSLFPILP